MGVVPGVTRQAAFARHGRWSGRQPWVGVHGERGPAAALANLCRKKMSPAVTGCPRTALSLFKRPGLSRPSTWLGAAWAAGSNSRGYHGFAAAQCLEAALEEKQIMQVGTGKSLGRKGAAYLSLLCSLSFTHAWLAYQPGLQWAVSISLLP